MEVHVPSRAEWEEQAERSFFGGCYDVYIPVQYRTLNVLYRQVKKEIGGLGVGLS